MFDTSFDETTMKNKLPDNWEGLCFECLSHITIKDEYFMIDTFKDGEQPHCESCYLKEKQLSKEEAIESDSRSVGYRSLVGI